MDEQKPPLFFLVAAPADQEVRRDVEKHLAPSKNKACSAWEGPIWCLREWRSSSGASPLLPRHSPLVLLLGADFYTACQAEICFLFSQGLEERVLPLLVRPVLRFPGLPFHNRQWLPRNGIPLVQQDRDAALEEISREVYALLQEKHGSLRRLSAEQRDRLQHVLADQRALLLNRPDSFVGREVELAQIQQRMVEKRQIGGYLTITGQAGQGKSSLMAKLVGLTRLGGCSR